MSAVPAVGPQSAGQKDQERRVRAAGTLVFLIIGLSIIISYDWGAPTPAFRPDAGITILFGIVVGAIVFIAARYNPKEPTAFGFRLRFCPKCGRQIRFDAKQCPYCGNLLP